MKLSAIVILLTLLGLTVGNPTGKDEKKSVKLPPKAEMLKPAPQMISLNWQQTPGQSRKGKNGEDAEAEGTYGNQNQLQGLFIPFLPFTLNVQAQFKPSQQYGYPQSANHGNFAGGYSGGYSGGYTAGGY